MQRLALDFIHVGPWALTSFTAGFASTAVALWALGQTQARPLVWLSLLLVVVAANSQAISMYSGLRSLRRCPISPALRLAWQTAIVASGGLATPLFWLTVGRDRPARALRRSAPTAGPSLRRLSPPFPFAPALSSVLEPTVRVPMPPSSSSPSGAPRSRKIKKNRAQNHTGPGCDHSNVVGG